MPWKHPVNADEHEPWNQALCLHSDYCLTPPQTDECVRNNVNNLHTQISLQAHAHTAQIPNLKALRGEVRQREYHKYIFRGVSLDRWV